MKRAVKIIVLAIAALLLPTGAFAGGMYAADYEVEATVVDKECAGPVPAGFEPEDPEELESDAESDVEGEAQEPQAREPNTALDGIVGANSTVTITARFLGFPVTVEVPEFPDDKCWILRSGEDGNFITINIRSETAVFYEREGGTCIFHTLFGPGCLLPGGPDELTASLQAATSFTLSTVGYAADPIGLGLGGNAANCVELAVSDALAIQTSAMWAPTTTDGTLRLVLTALAADGSVVGSSEATGGPGIEAGLEITGVESYRIAMYPTTEPVGTTSGIVIALDVTGVDALPEPRPTDCSA